MIRRYLVFAAVLALPLSVVAQQGKPCEDLKSEIAKKLDDKGVKSYSLDIVEKDKDAAGKVVGTCEGGTKKIVYTRADAPQQGETVKAASKK